MPRGRYSLHDPHDHTPLGDEHFQCAHGPSGWRYVAQITSPSGEHAGSIDLTLDALARPIRMELHAGGWRVRGAAMDGVTWVRTASGGEGREHNAAAHSFAGQSPAFLVATARLLAPELGQRGSRGRLVYLAPPVLAPRTINQTWALVARDAHGTDTGPLTVESYQVGDLDTGEGMEVHLAGDVVLAAPGVELEELDSPPSTST
ncbi:hypothetical protein [Streptomyces oceani]|uniref:Uncharacterized protein n=1 Tax=Streptomyces oceani TaxID=1075402 RepID=A0A1E7KNC5_9ACTN|nr:hypothetical protein [Streptomyces oceani]OEV05479.1 hypothetical protein AN216_03215 [Streptomyces oceani]